MLFTNPWPVSGGYKYYPLRYLPLLVTINIVSYYCCLRLGCFSAMLQILLVGSKCEILMGESMQCYSVTH